MKIKLKNTKMIVFFICMVVVLACMISFPKISDNYITTKNGQIFLYGEEHGIKNILDKEFQLWEEYYQKDGMRDLFLELPYYTAEFLNLWIQSEEDDILNELYQDWNGTSLYCEEVIEFYQKIKCNCPDTVFHGTDVGHQYDTTGLRYLEFLRANGQEASEKYTLSEEAIEQGKYYYEHSDAIYRENKMTENFIREYNKLNGSSIMGIYGSAHTGLEAMDYLTNTIPCMGNQLKKRYGESVISEDLSGLAYNIEPIKTDQIQIGTQTYNASYFGKADLTSFSTEYQYREFWRLENAYDDFKNQATTGNVLPYYNYPMMIETGQIFVIDYTKTDGSVVREYHRSDGHTWQGNLATEEFIVEMEERRTDN